jgi:acyl carrier protein
MVPTSGLDISGGRDKIGEIYHNRARRIFMSDTFGDVKEIIIDLLGVPEEKVTPEAKFREDLEADSLDLVELIMAFEDKFGGEISDEDAQTITTVGEAVKYIDDHMRG